MQPDMEVDLRKYKNTFFSKLIRGQRDSAFISKFNETWFSNTLAWLLDPKREQDLGIDFVAKFVQLIIDKVGIKKEFNLKNSVVVREFYLISLKGDSFKNRYADLALIDFDTEDNLLVLIENKLFSSDSKEQLKDYIAASESFPGIENKYVVYLTLFGTKPKHYMPSNDKVFITLSWIGDILPILSEINSSKLKNNNDLELFIKLLNWIKNIDFNNSDFGGFLSRFLNNVTLHFTNFLEDYVERKNISIEYKNITKNTINFGTKNKFELSILPNLSILVKLFKGKKLIAKYVIPFLNSSDQYLNYINFVVMKSSQTFNLTKLNDCFGKSTSKPFSSDELLQFAFQYYYQIKVLLQIYNLKTNKLTYSLEDNKDIQEDEERHGQDF